MIDMNYLDCDTACIKVKCRPGFIRTELTLLKGSDRQRPGGRGGSLLELCLSTTLDDVNPWVYTHMSIRQAEHTVSVYQRTHQPYRRIKLTEFSSTELMVSPTTDMP